MKHVKSDIPQGAIETSASEENDVLNDHRVVDCLFKGQLVGRRVYNREGVLILEAPMREGLKHGREITWDDDGTLLLIEPYVKGKIHGTAKQYGRNGKVIGTYTIHHGTGLDVWRQEDEDHQVFVSEIHHLQDVLPNSYEWGFASSKEDLWQERNWNMGKLHGIERVWNNRGRLRRGYPKFYIADRAVSRQKYIKMALSDKSLPVYREKDDLAHREWPEEIKRLILSKPTAARTNRIAQP